MNENLRFVSEGQKENAHAVLSTGPGRQFVRATGSTKQQIDTRSTF